MGSNTGTPADLLRREHKRRIPYQPFEDAILQMLAQLRPEDVLPPGEKVDAGLQRITELTKETTALADRLATLESQQNDPDLDADLLPSVQRGIVEVRRRHKERAKQLQLLEEEVHTNRTKTRCVVKASYRYSTPRAPPHRQGPHSPTRRVYLASNPADQPQQTHRPTFDLYLRGGRTEYATILPKSPPPGLVAWDLAACDFRAGEIGDAGTNAKAGKEIG